VRVCALPDSAARKKDALNQHLFGRPPGSERKHAHKVGGDEDATKRSRLFKQEQSMVIKRRRFKQTHSLQERLAKDTERLLEQAKVLPLGTL
jgi:hypothetical protein